MPTLTYGQYSISIYPLHDNLPSKNIPLHRPRIPIKRIHGHGVTINQRGIKNRKKKKKEQHNHHGVTRLGSFYSVVTGNRRIHYSLLFFFSTLSNNARLIRGSTPPNAMVARINVSSSSSPRIASCRWRGVIRLTLRSLAALPANSRTSAVRYSRTAVVYTAAGMNQ